MEVLVLALQAVEFGGHDDFGARVRAVNETNVGGRSAFQQPARDGHARRDAAAGRKQQDVLGRRLVDDVEFAGRRQGMQDVTRLQMVEQVVRHLAAGNPFDGNRDFFRAVWRGRQRVGAVQHFVGDIDLKNDKLTGFEVERCGVVGLKNKGGGFGGFFDPFNADKRGEFAGGIG